MTHRQGGDPVDPLIVLDCIRLRTDPKKPGPLDLDDVQFDVQMRLNGPVWMRVIYNMIDRFHAGGLIDGNGVYQFAPDPRQHAVRNTTCCLYPKEG